MATLKHWVSTTLLFLALVIVLAFVVVGERANKARDDANREAVRMLICEEIETLKAIQKDILEESIADSRQFLKDHPQGIPGIPASLILEGIQKKQNQAQRLAPIAGGCFLFAQANAPAELPD